MKFNHSKAATRLGFFVAAVLIAGLFGEATQAQSLYRGKFTLDHQVRWGRAVIPAGKYTLVVDSLTEPSAGVPFAKVVDTKTNKTVAVVACPVTENSSGPTALILSNRGAQLTVHTLRVQELNESFIFDPSLAHHRAPEEANSSQTVPILTEKQ
jgi:hypothetical protein